jgi:hypothetical protein
VIPLRNGTTPGKGEDFHGDDLLFKGKKASRQSHQTGCGGGSGTNESKGNRNAAHEAGPGANSHFKAPRE